MRPIFIIIILAIAISCEKDREISYYPDCFKGLTNSSYKSELGCGNIFVSIHLDNHRVVSIWLNEEALNLKTQCRSFKIENDTNNIQINYYTYANHPDSFYFDFCDDLVFPVYGNKITWKAISGMVTAVVSRERNYRKDCEGYQTAIELDNIRFIKENTTQDTSIASLIIKDKWVGNCIP